MENNIYEYQLETIVQPKTVLTVQYTSGYQFFNQKEGYFIFRHASLPVFPEEHWYVDDTGAYPRYAEHRCYAQGFNDCEPHNYVSKSKLLFDGKKGFYKVRYYRDGLFTEELVVGMSWFFGAKKRIYDETSITIFKVLGDAMAEFLCYEGRELFFDKNNGKICLMKG